MKKVRWLLAGILLIGLACRQAPKPPAPSIAPGGGQPAASATAASTANSAALSPASAPAAQAAAPPAKPVPATLPAVLARVNGEEIAKAEFEKAVRNLEARAGQGVPFDKRDGIYRQVLDQLIGYRLLVQESRARKVAVTDAEVDAQIAQVRGRFPNDAAFTKALADQQTSLETLKLDTRTQMAVSKMLEIEIMPTISVTDKDVQTFYEDNKSRFNEPEAVRASHILIRFPENADDAAKKQAKARAEEVLAKLNAGGDFAALAKEYSQDASSAAKGGDLGFFPRLQTVPEFETVAFSLQPGQTSGLVETKFGYHIIRVAEHRAASLVPLSEASQQIQQLLRQQQQQKGADAFVDRLKAKAKIDILI